MFALPQWAMMNTKPWRKRATPFAVRLGPEHFRRKPCIFIHRIGDTLATISERTDAENRTTADVADQMALEKITAKPILNVEIANSPINHLDHKEGSMSALRKSFAGMVPNRLCEPESKLGVWDRWLEKVYLPSCDSLKLEHMYEAMDLLYEYAEEVEKQISNQTANLFNLHGDLIFCVGSKTTHEDAHLFFERCDVGL
jgi:hypothetical protein